MKVIRRQNETHAFYGYNMQKILVCKPHNTYAALKKKERATQETVSVIACSFVRFFCMPLNCIETLFFRLKTEGKYVNQTKQEVCLSMQRHFQVQKSVWKFF